VRKCPRCGVEEAGESLSCRECGQPLPALGRSLAQTAKFLGIAGYPFMCAFGVGYILALFAVLLGTIALVVSLFRPPRYGDRAAAGTGIVLGGILASVVMLMALPGMLTARYARNESTTIGDLRSIASVEVDYAKANADLYDTLDCLAAPARCIPGYDAAAPIFATPDLTAPERWGYRRTFHAGPAPKGGPPKGASPSSMTSFAVTAVPVGSSGRRAFCVDGSGRICTFALDAPPPVANGECAPEPACRELR